MKCLALLPDYANTVTQNTEDEVLKAAIAKYGKNQWYVWNSKTRCFFLIICQGSYIVAAGSEDTQTMQGTMV